MRELIRHKGSLVCAEFKDFPDTKPIREAKGPLFLSTEDLMNGQINTDDKNDMGNYYKRFTEAISEKIPGCFRQDTK